MFHEFAPLIDPILKLNWLCCGIAKTTMCTSKIAHFALVQKLVVVMDERIVHHHPGRILPPLGVFLQIYCTFEQNIDTFRQEYFCLGLASSCRCYGVPS